MRIKLFENFLNEDKQVAPSGIVTMYNLSDANCEELDKLGASVVRDNENSTEEDAIYEVTFNTKEVGEKILDWIKENDSAIPMGDIIHLYPGLFENLIKGVYEFEEGGRNKFYILNGSSKVDTKNPSANDLIEDQPKTYILLKSNKYAQPIILSGSGKPEGYNIKKGGELELFDDGNGTTKFPKGMVYNRNWKMGMPQSQRYLKNWGENAKVIAFATTPAEIQENFPSGKYQIFVMK